VSITRPTTTSLLLKRFLSTVYVSTALPGLSGGLVQYASELLQAPTLLYIGKHCNYAPYMHRMYRQHRDTEKINDTVSESPDINAELRAGVNPEKGG